MANLKGLKFLFFMGMGVFFFERDFQNLCQCFCLVLDSDEICALCLYVESSSSRESQTVVVNDHARFKRCGEGSVKQA